MRFSSERVTRAHHCILLHWAERNLRLCTVMHEANHAWDEPWHGWLCDETYILQDVRVAMLHSLNVDHGTTSFQNKLPKTENDNSYLTVSAQRALRQFTTTSWKRSSSTTAVYNQLGLCSKNPNPGVHLSLLPDEGFHITRPFSYRPPPLLCCTIRLGLIPPPLWPFWRPTCPCWPGVYQGHLHQWRQEEIQQAVVHNAQKHW